MIYLFWVMIVAFLLIFCLSMTSSEWQKLGENSLKIFLFFFWGILLVVLVPCVYIYGSNYYKMVIVGGVAFSDFKDLYPDYGWSQMMILYKEIYNQIGWVLYRMKH